MNDRRRQLRPCESNRLAAGPRVNGATPAKPLRALPPVEDVRFVLLVIALGAAYLGEPTAFVKFSRSLICPCSASTSDFAVRAEGPVYELSDMTVLTFRRIALLVGLTIALFDYDPLCGDRNDVCSRRPADAVAH